MEGMQSSDSGEGDWLSEGGSRAEAAAVHEYHGDQVGPAWLKRNRGDRIEALSEHHGVAQVYVQSREGCH